LLIVTYADLGQLCGREKEITSIQSQIIIHSVYELLLAAQVHFMCCST
jgi:hypothetical protein